MERTNAKRTARHRTSQKRSRIVNRKSSIVGAGASTLIELLVVISVIAVLMAVLLPSLARARQQAKTVVCQTNLKQWGVAFNLYAQDNKGRLPKYPIFLIRGAAMTGQEENISGKGDSYLGFHTKGMALCPAATKSVVPDPCHPVNFTYSMSSNGVSVAKFVGIRGDTFNAWTIISPEPAFRASYGYNDWVFSNLSGDWMSLRYASVDVLTVKNRASIPVLLDAKMPMDNPRDNSAPPAASSFCIDRHLACVNGVFLDGSVRRIGLKELWTLKWHQSFDTANRWTLAGGVKPEDWPKWMRSFRDY
jgi:type II secretory pathway pseudopilin PulG